MWFTPGPWELLNICSLLEANMSELELVVFGVVTGSE